MIDFKNTRKFNHNAPISGRKKALIINNDAVDKFFYIN